MPAPPGYILSLHYSARYDEEIQIKLMPYQEVEHSAEGWKGSVYKE